MPTSTPSPVLILVTLLIKLGLIASLASIIIRFGTFKELLFIEEKGARQKIQFAAFLGIPFFLGVMARLLAGYKGADLSLEVTLLAGLLGGGMVGLLVGLMVHLPAFLIGGEWMAIVMLSLYALVGSLVRYVCPDKEEIWKYSPFIELSLYRSIRRRFTNPGMDWQVLLFLVGVVLEISRIWAGRLFPGGKLFYLDSEGSFWTGVLIVLATPIGVGLPLRIWNSTRIERTLEEQKRLLMQARVESLTSQINPHFLFNTLNTVAALTRSNPAQAREVLVKLSNILRGRLMGQLNFVPLKQELEFVDDYLDIEVVRFGKEKIEIRREIDPETLSLVVPNMLLQPLVENALKHGIGPKIEGGILVIGAQRINGRLAIRVGDNGVGILPERREQIFASGIGISNVLERLKVIYGNDFQIDVDSQPGRGTEIRIEIPEVHSMPAPAALPGTTTASRTS